MANQQRQKRPELSSVSLLEEYAQAFSRNTKPPKNSFTALEFAEKTKLKPCRAACILREEVAEGKLKVAKVLMGNGRLVNYYYR